MKKTALIIATFLTILSGIFAVGRVRAQNQTVLPLTVVPPKQEVLINPGEHFSTSVKFLNQGDSPVTGSLTVLDFVVQDDVGTPLFLDNPQVVGTTEIPAQYSTEINFGLKIEALLDQASHQVIPKPLQHLFLGLLFSNFWDTKELNQLVSDKQKITEAYFSGKLKSLVLEITKARDFNFLAALLTKNTAFINQITGGSLQQKTTA